MHFPLVPSQLEAYYHLISPVLVWLNLVLKKRNIDLPENRVRFYSNTCIINDLNDCLFVCLFVFIYLFVCLFACLFVGVFVCLFVCVFITSFHEGGQLNTFVISIKKTPFKGNFFFKNKEPMILTAPLNPIFKLSFVDINVSPSKFLRPVIRVTLWWFLFGVHPYQPTLDFTFILEWTTVERIRCYIKK